MIRQLLRNGQVTLPKEAVRFFHLQESDLLDVRFDKSGIHMKPLAGEFTDAECAKLEKKLNALKKKSKFQAFKSASDALKHLDRISAR